MLLAEAAEWHAWLEQAGDARRAAFEAWRGASADHAGAFDRVQAAHDRAQALAEQGPLLALRQQTLARTMLAGRSRALRWRIATAGALMLAGAPLAAYGIHAWIAPRAPHATFETFRTGIGQQADVTLADGSIVTLDTASTLKVRLGEGVRQVTLDGQGWFRIKPGDTPFRISAGGRDFIAREGIFDVRTDADRVRAFAATGYLTLEGDASPVALAPGRLLAVRDSDVVIRTLDDPASFTGWRTGLLQFNDVPLAQAAAELNRYRSRPIRIADNRAAELRVSGAFHTAETPAFADALAAGFPVHVKQDSSGGVVVASR